MCLITLCLKWWRWSDLSRPIQHEHICFRCGIDYLLPYDSLCKYAWLCNKCSKELDVDYTERLMYQEEVE